MPPAEFLVIYEPEMLAHHGEDSEKNTGNCYNTTTSHLFIDHQPVFVGL